MSISRELKVEKWDEEVDGRLCEQSMERKLKLKGYSFTRYEFPPGMVFPDHSHNWTKKDSIVTGRFQFCMYGQTVTLEPGDMIDVPKKEVHNAAVKGSTPVVFYDATRT
ncbi:hypothetical protein KP79_PYT16567 [Mizuhopecten yessoensis]|uniref:Cupin type-2 domain-containing protein n=2 Tax=Mizuhopecten yessoensis TaxID=6573 RepID=A0A210PHM1_MIZYE|nr:hypothetical protein KP79_PYT16567 [Mizuhopecten yessoensis]